MTKALLDSKRRILLAAAVCAPAVAIGALLARRQAAAPPAPTLPGPEPASVGYHETDHIRKYYRSAAYL